MELSKAQSELNLHTQSFNFFETETDQWNAKTTELTEKANHLEKIYHEKIRGCFEWRFEFPEVLDDDGNFAGFDVVIGNPPYGVKFNKLMINYFSKNYQYQDYQFDSYMLFMEKAVILLKNEGYFGFIIPNTWLLNLKTPKIRQHVFSDTEIINIVHYQSPVFALATVDTEIVIFKNKKSAKNHKIRIDIYDKKNIRTEQQIEQQIWIDANGAPINIFDDEKNKNIKEKGNYSGRLYC